MLNATSMDGCSIQLPSSKVLGEEYSLHVDKDIVLDLVNVFSAVYIADISTKRSVKRNISVSAPVSSENLGLWEQSKGLILRLVNFVTEGDNDQWGIAFTPVKYQLPTKQLTLEERDSNKYDNVSLLSGGLDSFCGIHENEINNRTALYCGYKTSNVDTSYISRVYPFAKGINSNTELCLFDKVVDNKITPTQRTRSLLFFSLACFSATWKNINRVNVHENGIMTLNPSFESRGTTKTTHPKTIYFFQQLLREIGIDILIAHPFLFSTKGEMVSALPQQYLDYIKNTHSCSRSFQDMRYRRKGICNCGACVPCLLRKISLSAYDMENYDHNYYIPYQGNFNDAEYNSAYSYYERFANAVDKGEILANVELRKDYYQEGDYYEKTNDLLERFNKEMKIFFGKYGR